MADDVILDEAESTEDPSEFTRLVTDLESRCTAAKIDFELLENWDGEKYARIHLPTGRDRQPLSLFGAESCHSQRRPSCFIWILS